MVMASATDELEAASSGQIETISSAQKRLGTVVAATYRITRHIGSGGSSHVFEAEHLRLGKSFAVKVLRPELDTSRLTAQRFRREAKAIARLHSEHIITIVDCGELDDGAPYLVMELLEGEDLRSLLDRERALPARRAVPLVIEACRGLAAVHAAGLVHRDLKPENLFITRRSTGEDWCKVLDFGVAKMESSLSTAQGAIVGTLRYMAPEQLADSTSVGPATDVYALGAILFECLSGQAAHHGETAQEVMYSVMNRPPPAAALREANVPISLVDIVMSCLASEQELRPQNAQALVVLLSQSLGSQQKDPRCATLREDEAPARSARPRARVTSRNLIWGAALAVAATAALVWSVRPAATPRVTPTSAAAGTTHETPAREAHAPLATPPAPPSPQPLQAAPTVVRPSVRAPQTSASVASRRLPTPKPNDTRNLTPPTAQPPSVSVGSFDPANPYGE
jgi:serine/threonine protein kinase